MGVAFVALLAALTGTAVALPGTNTVNSGDIVNNTIRSKDVRNGTIVGKDVRNGRLTSADVKNDSLTGTDINEGTLGTVPNANHANSADSANTANSANNANNANTTDGVSQEEFTIGRSNSSGCNPSSTTFVNCASVTLTLPRSGRVLLNGTGSWHTDADGGEGECFIALGTAAVGDTTTFPGNNTNDHSDGFDEVSTYATVVSGVLAAGPHTFNYRCNQTVADFDVDEAMISAVMIGSG